VDEKKRKAIEVLVGGGTQAQAARAAGVNRSSIIRWLANPEFVEAITEHDLTQGASIGLNSLVPEALRLLKQALDDDDVHAPRARIALDIVKAAAGLAPAGADTGTLLSRIAELDAQGVGSD